MKFFCLLLSILCTPVFAEPYIPASGDEIIAHWPTPKNDALKAVKTASRLNPKDPATIVALANAYLAQAAQPGQSRLYGLAEAALKPLIDDKVDDKNIWLVWAQVQQHQHNFSIAQDALKKVLQQDPININANLLAARIDIIQEKPLAARNVCLKLLGSSDLLTVSACSLEANAYLHPENIDSIYQQLVQMVNKQGLPDDERATWLIQLLADMALRNNNPSAATEWLSQRLNNASVNYLAQWADAQLALNNSQTVLTHLDKIVSQAPEIDDALLLRLAIAEKNNTQNNSAQTLPWKTQLNQRILLREQRQDTLHASELALYYLDISPNPKRALYWAQINIANTREFNDKKLLARAEQANKIEGI